MKREIKFRGKRLDNRKWVYGDLGITADTTFIIGHSLDKVDPDTVGQFTGLKDKNGKEIYEGDIFRADDGIARSVFWSPGGFVYEEDPVSFGYDHRAPIYPYSSIAEPQNTSWIFQCCEIIGNIHDNPELLKN